MSGLLSFCHVSFSRPLIGQKSECYIVEEVIKVDELDKENISAALGKQDKEGKAELSCATLRNKPNQKFTYSGCSMSLCAIFNERMIAHVHESQT